MQTHYLRSDAEYRPSGYDTAGFDTHGDLRSGHFQAPRPDSQFLNRLSRTPFPKYGFNLPTFHVPVVEPAVYEMDHLVTFDVGTKTGVQSHADGIRKLRQMEATSGIWTRRVLISIDQRELVVTEKGTGDELETFPISHVADPLSYYEGNIPNVFNNLVIFVAQKESWTRQPSTLNIFQCIGVSAQEVVEDIKAACVGKFPRPKYTAPATPTPELNDQEIEFAPGDTSSGKITITEPQSSEVQMSGVAMANRVVILNRCFDDIESFVRQVQTSARELKNPTDKSTAEVRLHAPSKRDFVEILQKFKLCLNLIAELKDILRNPSASGLLHSFFPLLELIVNVCRDQQGEPKFVENILSPLLTADTCSFLENNLHGEELHLWKSLGNTWTVPRETWSGPAPTSYAPKFRESTTQEPATSFSSNVNKDNMQSNSPTVTDDSKQDTGPTAVEHEDFVRQQQTYLNDLKSRNCRVCLVTNSRQAKDIRELTLSAEEYLEVINDSKNWWHVRNSKNETGYAPKTILKPYFGF